MPLNSRKDSGTHIFVFPISIFWSVLTPARLVAMTAKGEKSANSKFVLPGETAQLVILSHYLTPRLSTSSIILESE